MTQFEHCKKAEIPPAQKGDPVIRCAVGFASTGGMLLALPRDYKCSSDTPVPVVFYDPLLGLTRCSCRLSAPVAQGDVCVYRCEVLETLSKQQRREDLKVAVSVPVQVRFRDRLWPGTIANISAGGVLLMSPLNAHKGDMLYFLFNEMGENIPLTAQVLRVELRPSQNGKLTYGYGCRFVDLKPGHESLLRNYVFQEERRMYFSNSNN